MRLLRIGVFFAVGSALAGCSGATSTPYTAFAGSPPTAKPATAAPSAAASGAATATAAPTASPTTAATATPAVTATPVATAMPTSATTTSVNGGAAVSDAPVSMPFAAPTGYAQTLAAALVSAPANTTIVTQSGTGVPPGLVSLSTARAPFSFRSPFAAPGTYSTIFYDSIVPSANITVAGNLSYTASFPSGGLSASTSYYLGYYDTTQASPAWQTIAGPASPSGANLTFSGSISPLTLVANKLYGFAIFSTVTPSATPPPAPQTLVYVGGPGGITAMSETGTVANTYAIANTTFDLDDAGNIYAYYAGATAAPYLAEYPAGSTTASKTYTPSVVDGAFTSVSGAGEVVLVHQVASGKLNVDEWDPGASGTPSRTITTSVPTGIIGYVVTHDGSLYLPDRSSAGVPQFDVFPPGSATASTVIPETILPASQYNNFSPNYAAVGADGTLYVTEYSFNQPDPNAGLYVYPLNGPERFIATATNAQGPGPEGVDVDASNNIYVANDNTATTSSTTCQGDTLNSVTEYSQSGALENTVTGSFTAFPLTTAADGTTFVASFTAQLLPQCASTGVYGIFAITPGSSTASQISSLGSNEIVLFDGTHKTEPFSKSARTGASRGAAALRRTIR